MINIVLGDCINELKSIRSNSVDLIIADPPYNVGKDYGNKSDKQDFDEYLEFSKKWLSECYRILKKEGTIYVFIGFRYISYLYQIMEKDAGQRASPAPDGIAGVYVPAAENGG
jgi:site-specific DNA-methyltransferase (adenine-specific)